MRVTFQGNAEIFLARLLYENVSHVQHDSYATIDQTIFLNWYFELRYVQIQNDESISDKTKANVEPNTIG